MQRYIIKHKKEFIGTICTSIASGLVPLYLAYVISIISDVAFNAHYEKISYCIFSCVLFLVYSFVSTSINSIMKSKYRKVLKQDLAQDVYTSLMSRSYVGFKKEKGGKTIYPYLRMILRWWMNITSFLYLV